MVVINVRPTFRYMSQIVDGRCGDPTRIHAARQHLPNVFTDFGVDQPIQLGIHGRQEIGVLSGGNREIVEFVRIGLQVV